MTDTLAVIALDAADYALARRWDCENILLENSGPLETFTYSADHPYTPEVWTSVATGVHPSEHEVTGDAADWDSLALRVASQATQFFPHKVRNTLGKPFRERGHRQEIHRTHLPHAFETGQVFGWPGIADATHLSEAWSWASKVSHGEMTERELRQRTMGNTGKEFGWIVGITDIDTPIAGVHSHVLDVTGHAFATREAKLREYYERVDSMLGWVRERTDELVVLSDHGIRVSWIDDGESGVHSNRAMVAATEGVKGDLPESVFDVRKWLELNTDDRERGVDQTVTMDTAEERLRELGYME
ncbi:hypothetical protein GRX01_11025 [Halobaculum sp. WSA2]|uniref:Type I phosphodiesterase / nucleotide pyrophosphatase n=1 Tax=Halobaculum saliterrae TaxID=2073113 RepID=A0A6B0SWF4_9EURY|nr:alkaline phosphatase family protein [Halobaculum saliterrae]MXR41866.1 hypothetical protein [Halobaculum saliterrae]